jgi:protein-disulfide isomerase
MTPIVNGLEEEFAGQVTVKQLDASLPENVQLQAEYGVRGHPSFIVLNGNGIVIQTYIGPQPEETLREVMLVAAP